MDHNQIDWERREFLRRMLALSAVGYAGGGMLVRSALAMAPQAQRVQGMRKLSGTVMINGAPAQENALVFSGDTISTGLASYAVFVVGKDAFLLRANSRIELDPAAKETRAKGKSKKGKAKADTSGVDPSPKDAARKPLKVVRVASGKVLAVFGEGERRIETATAVAAAGRAALYIEADADVTYLCCCYGKVGIDARAYPGKRAVLDMKRHDEPYYVLSGGWKKGFLRAPASNHGDDELAMLEGLVERTPLFSGGGVGGGS